MKQNNNPPEEVSVLYRKAGDTHVLTSDGINGLVHAGSSDPGQVHPMFIDALQIHVQKTYGVDAAYEHETGADAFIEQISDGAKHKFTARMKRI